MIDIIGKKWWFLLISGIVIIPGVISLILWGVSPSIDFTGGTLLELQIETDKSITTGRFSEIAKKQDIQLESVSASGDKTYLFRFKLIDKDQNAKFQQTISKEIASADEIRFETVGPTIGRETTQNAIYAVV